MTAYSIEIAYNSGWKPDEVAEKLREAVAALQSDPRKIALEARRFEPTLDTDMLIEYAESYREPMQDMTLRWAESDRGPCVQMLASGGGEARTTKEACRRAFCRLILEAMHRETMEVNIIVS